MSQFEIYYQGFTSIPDDAKLRILAVEAIAPTPGYASSVVERATGIKPVTIRRFTTGTSHFVYEALWPDRPSLVVRMGSSGQADTLRDGIWLTSQLRPIGVPLPKVLYENLVDSCPWVILERLPGVDLGEVINDLSERQLRGVAAHVAAAQRATAALGVPNGFGYAARLDAAPQRTWTAVLDDNVRRSRQRIATANLFDLEIVAKMEACVHAYRAELDAVLAIPFLHDTTTKNVIIAPDGRCSGIIDVDDLCFGDPRYAAALTLAVLLGYGGPTEYVDAWMSFSNHCDDQLFRLYVVMFLVDLMAEHGQQFNGNERPSDPIRRAGLTNAFATQIGRVDRD